MTPELDLSMWPSKPEAAKLLGISERTLDRMVKLKGYPEIRLRARKGLKPEPVVNPEDVQRIMAGRQVTAVMPAETAVELAVRPPSYPADQVLQVIDRIAHMGHPEHPALWLTLKEASAYSGLTMALLQRLASREGIEAVKDNGWKFRRAALDGLDIEKLLTLEAD